MPSTKTDTEGLKELAKLCYAPLLRYAISIARNEQLARDAVQESFLKYMNESKRREIAHPKAWLFTVCRNRIFDELKRSKRCVELGENAGADLGRNPGASAEISDGISRLKSLCERLGERERELLRLKFQCGFSYAQMAEMTSLSESNVGVSLHRALKELRQMFFEGKNEQPELSK